MSEKINADLAKQVRSELSTASATIPPDYWLSIPNIYGPGTTVIVVPVAGNLWVYYGIGSAPAQQIYVWHQGGSTTPIQQGENTIPVGAADMIVYQLANPSSDTIKIGYQYV